MFINIDKLANFYPELNKKVVREKKLKTQDRKLKGQEYRSLFFLI